MGAAILIAGNAVLARNAALNDWGWRETGFGQYRRRDGLVIYYVNSPEAMRGLRRGTLLFLGPQWWDGPIGTARDRAALLERFNLVRDLNQGEAG